MAELFEATKQNISLHVNNLFKEGELNPEATVKEYLTVQFEGEREVKRKVLLYNLDVIISVGYRVKSKRGTQFRIWANNILKDYLLKGYALNHRIARIEERLLEHDKKFDLIINADLKPTEGIFFDGQIFDAWQFVSGLIREAKSNIVLIDNFIDDSVLHLFTKREHAVNVTIYSANISKQLETDLLKYNQQYQPIELKSFSKSHDRFLIIDQKDVYHIGASLKDLGKKWFAFSKISLDPKDMISRLEA